MKDFYYSFLIFITHFSTPILIYSRTDFTIFINNGKIF